MPSFRLLISALFALALCGAPISASAQSFTDTQRSDIETIVRNYLIAHPEVLEEAMAELSKRQAAAEAAKHASGVANNADAIFNSPRNVTLGNKDGDVTFVEFFDYNCGYCKRALIDLVDIMKGDPKLRVVLKEFPVLGPASIEAAQVGVAQAALEKACQYVVQRSQFGLPLAEYQLTQYKIGLMAVHIAAARQATYASARTFDTRAVEPSMAPPCEGVR